MNKTTTEELNIMFDRATSYGNTEPDLLAIDAVASLVQNDSSLAIKVSQKIVDKLSSTNHKEIMQSLDVLEECMSKCGSYFHSEVGKFRFLNELIKLVSPKYSGQKTSKEVRDKILDLLLIWTIQYPEELKIKEAYVMLLKQGVEHDSIKRFDKRSDSKTKSSDDYFSKIPKKLLHSRDPKDTHAANLLILKMVEEDKRSAEIKVRRSMELKKTIENVSLLSDMLNQYKQGETSEDELTTIKELYNSCVSLQPSISRLTEDFDNNELLGEALEANDKLIEVSKMYTRLIIEGKQMKLGTKIETNSNSNVKLLSTLLDVPVTNATDELHDIFLQYVSPNINTANKYSLMMPEFDLLQDISGISSESGENNGKDPTAVIKPLQIVNALNDGQLIPSSIEIQTSKTNKYSPTEIAKDKKKTSNFGKLDLDSLVSNLKTTLNANTSDEVPIAQFVEIKNANIPSIAEEKIMISDNSSCLGISYENTDLKNIRPLSELFVDINSIRPGNESPKTILDDSQGLKIVLHFAKDSPQEDVSVMVINTMNQSTNSIYDYKFDASVSKPCKLRLLPPSGISLPGKKPFRPPTDDITQVILLSNKEKKSFSITCIISYFLENEPDIIKESFIVNDLPYLGN